MRHLSSSLSSGLGLLLLAVLLSVPALAQNGTIRGTVIDAETEEPLIQANVVIPGSNVGTATDFDGNYSLSLEPGTYNLEVRYLGYVTQTVDITLAAGETLTRDVMVEPDLTGLEEVVVTGVSSRTSRSRSEVAVSRVNAADLVEEVPYQDVASLLSGKVSGVNVQPASGNAGGGVRFIIRNGGGLNGDGQPVIYVDGVRISSDQFTGIGAGGQGQGLLADLSPDNIDSIDILKGPAAAALYGTSGSNGVVLITTKRGRFAASGTAFSARYKGVFGYNTNQAEYSTDNFQTAEDANALFQDGGINGQTVEISGGTPTISFFTSYDRRSENGILPQNRLERNNVRANFRVIPSDKVDVNVSAGYTLNEVNRPQNDNNTTGFLGNTLLAPPLVGSYALTDSLSIVNIQNGARTNRFIGSIQAEFRPIEGLSLRGSMGLDGLDLRQDEFVSPEFPTSGLPRGGRDTFVREEDNINGQLIGSYAFTPVEALQTSTVVGFQAFDRRTRSIRTISEEFPSGLLSDIGAGADITFTGESFLNRREFGVFAEEQLSYEDTYFFTLGLRREFASTIGENAPDVYYPRVSGAVRVDRLADVPSFVSLFKLRAAYGESGQLPNSTDGVRLLYEAENGGYGPGAVPDIIGNVDIEPENIKEFEVGIDAELLGGRIGLESTYYYQDATNSIIDFLNAPSTGQIASAVPFNVGSITGQGVELALTTVPYRDKANEVSFSVIYNYATNEVQELGEVNGNPAQPIFDGFDVNVIDEGLPRSAFFVLPVIGAEFREDGTYRRPLVGDERQFFGTPYPDHFGSFSLNLRLFRDFNIYALSDWQTGVSVFNNTQAFASLNLFGLPDNNPERERLADMLGLNAANDDFADLTPGTQEYIDAANQYARLDGRFDANFIEEADFLKLREVSLSYDFSRLINQTPGLSGRIRTLRLTLAGRNLLTTTKYSGPDPEVNFAGSRSLSRGADFLTLQNPRQFYATIAVGL